jgi:hypothetical protein
MADPFYKAEVWRRRADELRRLIGRTREPAARASLAGMADALDQHARKLEEMALKMRSTRRLAPSMASRRPQLIGAAAD